KEDYKYIRVQETRQVDGPFGQEGQQTTNKFQKIPYFVGNKVYSVSPYRIFPDTDLPLTRYQEGEFCGSEDMFSLSALRADETLFNLDKIPKFDEKAYKDRLSKSRIDVNLGTRVSAADQSKGFHASTDSTNEEGYVKNGSVVVTKVVIDITPADLKTDDGKKLGEEKHPVRYIVWYANDQTIIRFEEAYYLHGMFPYIISQFLPDQHRNVNESLADVCAPIAGLITWLINAHVTAQRSTIEGKFLVDPAGVDMKT